MTRLLPEMLLFSCMVAFVTGIVIGARPCSARWAWASKRVARAILPEPRPAGGHRPRTDRRCESVRELGLSAAARASEEDWNN